MSQRTRKLLTYGKSSRPRHPTHSSTHAGQDESVTVTEHQYTKKVRPDSEATSRLKPHDKSPLPKCSTDHQKTCEPLKPGSMKKAYAEPQKKRKRTGELMTADEIPSHQPGFRQEVRDTVADGGQCKRPDTLPPPRKPSRDSFLVRTSASPADFFPPHGRVAGSGQTMLSCRRRLVDLLAEDECPAESKESSPNTIIGNESKLPNPVSPSPSYKKDSRSSASTSSDVDKRGPHEPSCLASINMRSPGVTYARQRSFLGQTPAADGGSGDDYPASSKARRGMGQLPAVTESDPFLLAVEDDDDANGTGPVRSIHELRQAGGNARFVESVESIFEEIEDPFNTPSGRCLGFVQLCTRLLDAQFRRGFLECDFDKRLSESFNDQFDVITSSLALCAYELICLHGPLAPAIAISFWSGIIALSPTLLDEEDDLLGLIKRGDSMHSRAVRASVDGLLPSILSVLSAKKKVPFRFSPRVLALQCLQLTLSNAREQGERDIANIPLRLLMRLVDLLLAEGQAEVGKSTNDDQNALRPLSRLCGLLTLKDCGDDWCGRLRVLYMRLVLNITNVSSTLSCSFATPQLVGGLARIAVSGLRQVSGNPRSNEDNNSLDTTILALGCLINLTEASEVSRRLFLESDAKSAPALSVLLYFFVSSVGRAEEVRQVAQNQFRMYIDDAI